MRRAERHSKSRRALGDGRWTNRGDVKPAVEEFGGRSERGVGRAEDEDAYGTLERTGRRRESRFLPEGGVETRDVSP